MEEGNQQHLQPLLQPTTKYSAVNTSSSSLASSWAGDVSQVRSLEEDHVNNINYISSSSNIFLRLSLIFFIGVISLWANYEASKGFNITIVNEAKDTPSGKRFALFYVSNDEISRLVIDTSKFVEEILYPDETYPKKQVNHVVIRLASRNLTDMVVVDSSNNHEYTLDISRSVMEEGNFNHAMFQAVQKGMARIWLWDGQGKAPQSLVKGMVEYLTTLALSRKMSSSTEIINESDIELRTPEAFCSKELDDRAVARFLNYCEKQHKQGFVRGLNQGMKDDWRNGMVYNALGKPAQNLCASNNFSVSFAI